MLGPLKTWDFVMELLDNSECKSKGSKHMIFIATFEGRLHMDEDENDDQLNYPKYN